MEGLASPYSCHETCLAFWQEPRHKYTWCHHTLRGQAQVGDRNPSDHILMGESLLQLCCAAGWVAEEGRTRNSLHFPFSFLAQAHTHPLTPEPSQSFHTFCSLLPGFHIRSPRGWCMGIEGISF